MGSFRFWRRIKIFPGVELNFSKSGVSISFGKRGLKLTIGKGGIRFTTGLPGTRKNLYPSPKPETTHI